MIRIMKKVCRLLSCSKPGFIYSIKGKAFLVLILIGMLFFSIGDPYKVKADKNPPERKITTEVTSTIYEWWMVYWSDNSVACDIFLEHEGAPTDLELQNKCSFQLFNTWKNTPDCSQGHTASCTGVYLHQVNTTPIKKVTEEQISPPSITISLSQCSYENNSDYCIGDPFITFTGIEPLPNERITRIYGMIGSQSFTCKTGTCSVSLPDTGMQGIKVLFQGDSSYGDSTEQYVAYARVIPIAGREKTFSVDVISPEFVGREAPSCSDIWNVFPESTELPKWLNPPQDVSELESSSKLYFLSAALIKHGLVDASMCENGGLETDDIANECGVSASDVITKAWQNQFDQDILSISRSENVPASLVKNGLIRESQLWPGKYSRSEETGIGQLTQNGADTVLLWNTDFYSKFCPTVLGKKACSTGYAQLSDYSKGLLNGSLLQKVNGYCPTCENGIDKDKINFSIQVYSEALKANCSQVDQLVENLTGRDVRGMVSYSDLWRFTLANYNVGPGCLGDAITKSWNDSSTLDWKHVSANLDTACQKAVDYVSDISNGNTEKDPFLLTPLPTAMPTTTEIETETPTPEPTQK